MTLEIVLVRQVESMGTAFVVSLLILRPGPAP
jgi:hypothetical protein